MAKKKLPEMQPLAQYAQRLIDACQVKLYRLTKQYPPVSNSTLRDLVNGYNVPDTTTLVKASESLSKALLAAELAELVHDPYEYAIANTGIKPEPGEELKKVIYRVMVSLMPIDVDLSSPKKEVNPDQSEVPIKTPQEIVSWVQYHFYKLSLPEQMETLSKLSAMQSRAIDKWQEGDGDNKNPLEALIAEIKRSMAQVGVTTAEDYAKEILTGDEFLLSDRHPDIPKFATALQEILDGRLDPEGENTFACLGYLASVLCDGKFDGDVTSMLMSLVFSATEEQEGS